MKKLINSILECLLDARKIPEEMLYKFSGVTTEIVQNGCTEVIPEEFWELESYVQAYWRGEKYLKSDDAVQIYQMGRLLSYTNMLAILVEHKEKEVSVEDYAVQLKDKYLIFKEIQNSPGITHKELAHLAGMSASSLSQFVNKYKLHGFFRARTMGREKHYYLTEYGRKLYSAMKARYERPILVSSKELITRLVHILQIQNDMQNVFFAGKEQNINYNVYVKAMKSNFGDMTMSSGRNERGDYLTVCDFSGRKKLPGKYPNIKFDCYGKDNEEGHSWRTNKSLKMQEMVY